MAGWNVKPNTSPPLPSGAVGVPYSVLFDNYFGGTPNYTGGQPYSYTIASGVLPPGLSFSHNSLPAPPIIPYSNIGDPDTTILLSGTPTLCGTYNFSILWVDSEPLFPITQLSDYVIDIPCAPTPPKKKNRGGIGGFARLPNDICFRPESFPKDRFPNGCPEQIKYPNNYGAIYFFVGINEQGNCCYKKRI